MLMKFDHVMTIIIESHGIYNMLVGKLQGSIQSHWSRILEKAKGVRQKP